MKKIKLDVYISKGDKHYKKQADAIVIEPKTKKEKEAFWHGKVLPNC